MLFPGGATRVSSSLTLVNFLFACDAKFLVLDLRAKYGGYIGVGRERGRGAGVGGDRS